MNQRHQREDGHRYDGEGDLSCGGTLSARLSPWGRERAPGLDCVEGTMLLEHGTEGRHRTRSRPAREFRAMSEKKTLSEAVGRSLFFFLPRYNSRQKVPTDGNRQGWQRRNDGGRQQKAQGKTKDHGTTGTVTTVRSSVLLACVGWTAATDSGTDMVGCARQGIDASQGNLGARRGRRTFAFDAIPATPSKRVLASGLPEHRTDPSRSSFFFSPVETMFAPFVAEGRCRDDRRAKRRRGETGAPVCG